MKPICQKTVQEPPKLDMKVPSPPPIQSPELVPLPAFEAIEISDTDIAARLAVMEKQLLDLMNAYQGFSDFKVKINEITETADRKADKQRQLDELEKNMEVLLKNLRSSLDIKVKDVDLEKGMDQIEHWLQEQPIPNYKYAAFNAYHYLNEVIKAREDVDSYFEQLKLLVNNLRPGLKG